MAVRGSTSLAYYFALCSFKGMEKCVYMRNTGSETDIKLCLFYFLACHRLGRISDGTNVP